jgi:hypothetical protein
VEFRPDGTYVQLLIGRGDAPSPGPSGRWDTTGRLTPPGGGGAGGQEGNGPAGGGAGHIVALTPDRLEIAWQG